MTPVQSFSAEGPAAPHDHSVAFYETEESLVGSVAAFLAPAVDAGEPAMVVATPEHRRRIQAALAAQRPGAPGPSPLILLDAAETLELFMRDGVPDPDLFFEVVGSWIDRATGGGHATVRIFGEMVAVLWEKGHIASAIALEDLWNHLAAARAFTLFCAYPVAPPGAADARQAFGDVCARHSSVTLLDSACAPVAGVAPEARAGESGREATHGRASRTRDPRSGVSSRGEPRSAAGRASAGHSAMPHGLIGAKIRPPATGGFVHRSRIVEQLDTAVTAGRTVLVVAAAGSGKSVAVADYASRCDRPVAWLGVDSGDRAPGRLVTYLAAALDRSQGGLLGMIEGLLADGVSHDECAGLLGERAAEGGVVVFDDLHRLGPDGPSPSLVRTFLRYLSPSAAAILISRTTPHVEATTLMLDGRVEMLSDVDLAFRGEEARALLSAHAVGVDASEIERGTSGWAAGILLHARRAAPGRAPLATGEDPLWVYLNEQIIDPRPPAERRAILASAVLDVVSLEHLGRLIGSERAAAMFPRIVEAGLPASPAPAGIRYTPQVRELLLRRLREEAPDEVCELRAAYGRALIDDGLLEEGVDALIGSRHIGEAEVAAERALPALRRRGDSAKILEWSAALGEDAHRRRPALREAQLRALLALRRHGDAERVVNAMLATGELSGLVASAPHVVSWAVWCLHGSGEWPRLLSLLPPEGDSGTTEVKSFMLEVGCGADPPRDPAALMAAPFRPIHVLLQTALYYQGRLAEVERLGRAARDAERPAVATLARINIVNALTMRGDLAGARRVLDDVPHATRSSRLTELWCHAGAELALEEGDHDEALALIREARAISRRHEWHVGDLGVFGAVEGRILVRAGRYEEACATLRAVRAWCAARGLAAFREWADAWLTAAMLLQGDTAGQALHLARTAVGDMSRAGRRLELPAAAVFLAEAAWREGDEEAHDAATQTAYRAASACGTLAPLRRAVNLFPSVLVRAIDADASRGGDWRRLARARLQADADAEAPVLLRIRSFGTPSLESGSRPLAVTLLKALELAAYVARGGAAGVSRRDVVADVFEGSAAAGTYLRQALHRLRRVLPSGVDISARDGRLAWAPAAAVESDDVRFERLVARARTEVGARQRTTLEEALALVRAGPYIAPVDAEHVVRTRRELTALATEARVDFSRAARAEGDASLALEEMRRAVRDEPYREDAWEERLRTEAAAIGPGAVLSVFEDYRHAVAEIGLEPSGAIIGLLERLRAGTPSAAPG